MPQFYCPYCFATEGLRPSRLRLKDMPLLLIGKRPYRCRHCSTRFYSRVGSHAHLGRQPGAKNP